MAKKFGKFMLMSSIGAAVGAGIYYYMKGKKEVAPEDNFDADDFDDFDDDLDDDFEEDKINKKVKKIKKKAPKKVKKQINKKAKNK